VLREVGRYIRQHHLALIALFVALSGTAYAASKVGPDDIARNAVRSKHVKNHALLPEDSKMGAIAAFAFVRDLNPLDTSTATVAYGRGVASVDDPGSTSPYTVTFKSSVRHCIVQAVPGAGKPWGDIDTSFALGRPASVDMDQVLGNRAVQLYFRDHEGGVTDSSFLITAIC
jgi:hypothetical protein